MRPFKPGPPARKTKNIKIRKTMITEQPRDDVIAAGARHPGENLIEQAGYTAGIAAADGQAMAGLLPAGYLNDLKTVIELVRDTLKDREFGAQESKFATRGQNQAMRRAKQWMRKVARRAKRAEHMGRKMPDLLLSMPNEKRIADVAKRMDQVVNEFEKNMSAIPGGDNAAVLEEGKAIAKSFLDADAAQEIKRLKDLPEKVREYYFQKGLLYTGLKVVNEAGHELHLYDPVAAAKYNMKILYRGINHGPRPATADQPGTQPGASAADR